MTYPCIDETHFTVDGDGGLTPQPYMQWRHVALNETTGIQREYDIDGGDQAEDLLELQVEWTNPDPLPMHTYGLLTRGGTIVQTNVRNRVYVETYYGEASGASPADPTTPTLFGRCGNGADLGTITNPDRTIYTNIETRQGERSSLIGTPVLLATGETYKLRIRLRWDGAFWETLPVAPSESETELSVITGPTRLDLYAYPEIV